MFRPYQDSDSNIDMSQNLTSLSVYFRQYWRPLSNFNPTFTSQNTPYPLNLTGMLTQNDLSQPFQKFIGFNSNFTLRWFNCTEYTVDPSSPSTNPLIMSNYGPYTWSIIDGCYFNVSQAVYTTLQGANMFLKNSIFNITQSQYLILFFAITSDCTLYQPQNTGIANNIVIDNNTFFGINIFAWDTMIHNQNHANFTMTNNRFIDFYWYYGQYAIVLEHFDIGCQVYTSIGFYNNSFYNSVPIYSNFFYYISLPSNANNQIVFNNNSFENIMYDSFPLFRVQKPSTTNTTIQMQENTFLNVQNIIGSNPAISIIGDNITITNLTIINSKITSFLQLQALSTQITGIAISNTSTANIPLTSSSSFIDIGQSTNITIRNLSFLNCQFSQTNAINMITSNNLTMTNVEMKNITTTSNSLVTMFQTMNFTLSNFSLQNVYKTTQNSISIFDLTQLQPSQFSSVLMQYNFSNISLTQSNLQMLNIENLVDLGNQNIVLIFFRNLTIQQFQLEQKDSLIVTNIFSYRNFIFQIQTCYFTNLIMDLGSVMELQHTSSQFQLSQCTLNNIQGTILTMLPYENLDTSNPQTVFIQNSTLQNNSASTAILQVSENTNLQIVYTSFTENYSLDRGSILFIQNEIASANFTNCTFSQNYAIQGGVFFTQIGGKIQSNNCSFLHNFAQTGGVLYQQSEGLATFVNSTFINNSAIIASLIYSINSQSIIRLSGGFIKSNGLSQNGLMIPLLTKNILTLNAVFSKVYISYLYKNYDVSGSIVDQDYQFQMVMATLIFDNLVQVKNQTSLLKMSSSSLVQMLGLIYSSTNANGGPLITGDTSTFESTNLTFVNISTNTSLLQFSSNSQVILTDTFMNQSNSSFIQLTSSTLIMNESAFSNNCQRSSQFAFIHLLQSEVSISNMIMQNILSIQSKMPIIFLSNTDIEFNGLFVANFQLQLIQAEMNSNIALSNSSILNNSQNSQGPIIQLAKSSIIVNQSQFLNLINCPVISSSDNSQSTIRQQVTVINSLFSSNSAINNGGAIQVQDVDAQIINSSFINNSAQEGNGGAINYLCSLQNIKKCNFILSNNNFIENSALLNGGAINYNLYQPIGLENNTYNGNKAQYGNSFASYPFELQFIGNSSQLFQNISSGTTLDNSILIGVFDQNGQIVTTDASSQATMYSQDILVQIGGLTKAVAKNGIFTFNGITLVAQPEYTTVLSFSTDAINDQILQQLAIQTTSELQVNAEFRPCEPGEIVRNNQCNQCLKGTYSFDPSIASCQKCFLNAVCVGGDQSLINPGYWRSSLNSSLTYECPNQQACLGGINSDCLVGYKGILCNTCDIMAKDGNSYGKSGAYTCIICQQLYSQIILLIVIVAALGLYTAYILNNLITNPNRNKPQTVLIRILTNYFQTIMIVKEFDLSWPTQVQTLLDDLSIITSALEQIVSLDCMYIKSGIGNNLTISSFFLKVISFGILPILLTGLAMILWGITFRTKRKALDHEFVENITVTSFIMIYLLYPTIANLSFSLFNCQTLDNGISYLKRDLTIQCGSNYHIKMAVLVGVPIIAVWVVGFPSFIFLKIWKQRKNLDDKMTVKYYGLFYGGLNDDSFFWEIGASNIRKVVFIMCSTLLSTTNSTVKALAGIAIILAQSHFLHYKMPYIDPRFNHIEYLSQYSGMLTLFGGLFFVQEEVQQNNDILLLFFLWILLYNLYFLGVWTKTFIITLIRVHVETLSKFVLCRCLKKIRVNNYSEDLKEAQASQSQQKSIDEVDRQDSVDIGKQQFDENFYYNDSFNGLRSSNEISQNNSPRFALPSLSDGKASRRVKSKVKVRFAPSEPKQTALRPFTPLQKLELEEIPSPISNQMSDGSYLNFLMSHGSSPKGHGHGKSGALGRKGGTMGTKDFILAGTFDMAMQPIKYKGKSVQEPKTIYNQESPMFYRQTDRSRETRPSDRPLMEDGTRRRSRGLGDQQGALDSDSDDENWNARVSLQAKRPSFKLNLDEINKKQS